MARLLSQTGALATIPAKAGIGLRPPHYQGLVDSRPKIGWLEVHSENYFGRGGAPLYYLEKLRGVYPVSLHGVGLSLGSTDPLDRLHLQRLKDLAARIEPILVSEHLSWSSMEGAYLNDLIPLPYTEEALDHLVNRIRQTQDFLGRRILIENPSSYLEFTHSTLSEPGFLVETSYRADCGILLDINNVYVSCRNHGWNAVEYLNCIPAERVEEIHLAGHCLNRFEGGEILIDTHDRPVCEAVWHLYEQALDRFGPCPTLVEWDTNLPRLDTLVGEARRADLLLEAHYAQAA